MNTREILDLSRVDVARVAYENSYLTLHTAIMMSRAADNPIDWCKAMQLAAVVLSETVANHQKQMLKLANKYPSVYRDIVAGTSE